MYINHNRISFSILDILRDVGGVLVSLRVIFSILIDHHSKFNYLFNALKSLYLVNTKHKFLFRKVNEN